MPKYRCTSGGNSATGFSGNHSKDLPACAVAQGTFLVKMLVALIGRPECGRGYDLRDKGTVPVFSRCSELVAGCEGCLLLVLIEIKDHGPVLGAGILPLAIRPGWIVYGPEHIEQLPVRNDCGIIHNPHCFDMAGGTFADLPVGRIGY